MLKMRFCKRTFRNVYLLQLSLKHFSELITASMMIAV